MAEPVHILHVHSTFTLGGKEARAVRLMNLFGGHARHTVLSGVPGAIGARDAIDPAIDVHFPQDHPPLVGRPGIGRYHALARYMRGFDLVLSYNWGAMDAVMARRLFSGPPLVHHEDGFNVRERNGPVPGRSLFRRLAFPAASALVVPSVRLERIAHDVWKQPAGRVRRIANGIALAGYDAPPSADAIPGLEKRPGEIVVGTLAGLRPIKNLRRLVRAFAAAQTGAAAARLVIVGEGPDREAIAAEAGRAGVADRVLLPGFLPDPARYIGLFDIFALSSDSEQFPISLVEAMAAGKPAVSTDVGDVAQMVAEPNRAFVVPVSDEGAFAAALGRLIADDGLRHAVGEANRARAQAEYGEDAMVDAYRSLYSSAIGRPGALG
ncbi:glycosyltransferase [Flavisphingomonas formosensis]|uniref:glycosyltransferase n=1 Tax=Flavisphingomonas formosensis TaxID=861534 RepID=UPI0012F7FA70|nr:glycosyltransferase [Sphingomonas formosensis]